MTKAAPGLRRLVDRYRFAAGSEGIDFQGGGRYRMIAPTQEAGHGETVDLALVDEAWSPRAFGDFHVLQALTPAMSTRRGRPTLDLLDRRQGGIAPSCATSWTSAAPAVAVGDDDGLAYFEWSAPSDVDLDDRAVWAAAHPALGNTISEDVLVQARRDLPAEEFARAFLNIWPDETTNDDLTVGAAGTPATRPAPRWAAPWPWPSTSPSTAPAPPSSAWAPGVTTAGVTTSS